ncbi:hypothetical protein AVEN_196817-1 [Araneus ventricosus]|uniref:Uncharacterized protein n=1 Tax=Araneus ventricosus TaxID=182803 RepID=A0A4Y2JHN7_ARAVE|nr:hypothetical protein AVEN_196817-1 [Araneus ventricosus]
MEDQPTTSEESVSRGFGAHQDSWEQQEGEEKREILNLIRVSPQERVGEVGEFNFSPKSLQSWQPQEYVERTSCCSQAHFLALRLKLDAPRQFGHSAPKPVANTKIR